MGCAEVEVIEVQYKFKLIVVKCAELVESLLYLLHSVDVLGIDCVHSHFARIIGVVRDDRA